MGPTISEDVRLKKKIVKSVIEKKQKEEISKRKETVSRLNKKEITEQSASELSRNIEGQQKSGPTSIIMGDLESSNLGKGILAPMCLDQVLKGLGRAYNWHILIIR